MLQAALLESVPRVEAAEDSAAVPTESTPQEEMDPEESLKPPEVPVQALYKESEGPPLRWGLPRTVCTGEFPPELQKYVVPVPLNWQATWTDEMWRSLCEGDQRTACTSAGRLLIRSAAHHCAIWATRFKKATWL
ncbi:unnamed protein product [Cladocopium goreaui]|uniref:Uncharacterized protein n=1 Tax=Cladocopium goreaui TaxID=2562237 RepID=A0A9P1CS84_9DINO|nr:unnamed protein product [Cladocopium goreaui]